MSNAVLIANLTCVPDWLCDICVNLWSLAPPKILVFIV